MTELHVSVREEDFLIDEEVRRLRSQADTGAVVTFSGLVRELHGDSEVRALFLEHYPGMTERSLYEIMEQAAQRWPLQVATVIHRIGRLEAGEQIVFVGVASRHRHAAFAACEFIMDYLKTRAPFWKKSLQADGEHWVEAKAADTEAASRWDSRD
jgi:molybdopterin synthase catalytic subunit